MSERAERRSKVGEREIPKSELNNMPKLTQREERKERYGRDSDVTDRAASKSQRKPERTLSETQLKR